MTRRTSGNCGTLTRIGLFALALRAGEKTFEEIRKLSVLSTRRATRTEGRLRGRLRRQFDADCDHAIFQFLG